MLRKNYLNKEALVNLKNYKYVAGNYSIIDKIINPFWVGFTELFPMWLAPNMVTLVGLMLPLLTALLFATQDLTQTKTLDSSYYLFAFFAEFLYQTLDACDGKQARRTGSSSPLG